MVNHTKLHGTSFIKQKYLAEITGTLINWSIKNSITNCYWQTFFAKHLAEGLEKPRIMIQSGVCETNKMRFWAQPNWEN